MKTCIALIGLLLGTSCILHGQSVVRSTVGAGGSSQEVNHNGKTYFISQSIGQSGVIGTSTFSGHTIRQGYQQPPYLLIADRALASEDILPVVYPNPFSQEINIAFNEKVESDIAVNVSDISGRSMLQKTFSPSQQIAVSMDGFADGQYILSILTGDKKVSKAIIKMNR